MASYPGGQYSSVFTKKSYDDPMEKDQIDEFIPHRCARTDVPTKFRWQRKERELVENTGVDERKICIFLVARKMARHCERVNNHTGSIPCAEFESN